MVFQAKARPRTCRLELQTGPHRTNSRKCAAFSSCVSSLSRLCFADSEGHQRFVTQIAVVSQNSNPYPHENDDACGWSGAMGHTSRVISWRDFSNLIHFDYLQASDPYDELRLYLVALHDIPGE